MKESVQKNVRLNAHHGERATVVELLLKVGGFDAARREAPRYLKCPQKRWMRFKHRCAAT
jgi:hypothetical protein